MCQYPQSASAAASGADCGGYPRVAARRGGAALANYVGRFLSSVPQGEKEQEQSGANHQMAEKN